MKKLWLLAIAMPLAACASSDMQGNDPKEYYAGHPIKNTVITREQTLLVHFAGATSLAKDDIHKLHATLQPISPLAADSIRIQLNDADMKNEARKEALVSLLFRMGYAKDKISFQPSDVLLHNEAHLVVAYLVVVPPDCPDWQTSPVTTYSNTTQGNTGCAEETNIGLMIADPHDLLHGTGDVPIDTERSARVMQDYRGGKDYMPATLSAGTSNSAGSGGSSSSSNSGSGGSGSSSSGSSATPAASSSSALPSPQ